MTAERVVRHNIVCDHDKVGVEYRDCRDRSRVITSSAVQARRLLKEQGWTRPRVMIDGEAVDLDLCPSCSVKGTFTRAINNGGRPPKVKADG